LVIAAEQHKICESAVDIVAEKIPAKIKPIKNCGKTICDKIGKESSGS
jgi:hypothetical protein